MIHLKGKNGTAKVFTDNIEKPAIDQIIGMLNAEITKGKQVRIMPDVHAGKGSTIGTTIMGEMDKISPNIVGVDIGCGISMRKLHLSADTIDLAKLDEVAHRVIPSGFRVHEKAQDIDVGLDKLTFSLKNKERVYQSIGTLGGGNHYLEMAVDENGDVWLSVHSGSRGLGVSVASYHQSIADSKNTGISQDEIDKGLAFLTGDDLENYLNDMVIAQNYAVVNRQTMLDNLISEMGWETKVVDGFDSMHNYIDVKSNILRKGATSAQEGERLVIPLNMRDGSLICMGKGNPDWNYSAPHGAGRAMSRSKAKKTIDLEVYQEQMKGIYSTSVVEGTLDEAPDAYKPAEEIIANITDAASVIHHIKPIWNMKAK